MIKIFFAFIFLHPLIGFCQERQINNHGKLKIGLSFSPNYCFRQLRYTEANKWIGNMRNNEIPKRGFTTGANLQYQINKKIILETGLLYSDQGEKTKVKDIVWITPDPAYPIKSNVIYHYQYIDLPLTIQYRYPGNRINYFFTTGIIMNVFLVKRTAVTSQYADGNKNTNASAKDLGYAKLNLSAKLGFGLNYKISNRLSIQIEPVFHRSITSILTDKSTKEYLYHFGICSGVYYNFQSK